MGFNLLAQQAHFGGIVLHPQHDAWKVVGASVEPVPHDPPSALKPGGGQPDQKLVFKLSPAGVLDAIASRRARLGTF
jgi:hypothetical protein